jgi:hypothetical protein
MLQCVAQQEIGQKEFKGLWEDKSEIEVRLGGVWYPATVVGTCRLIVYFRLAQKVRIQVGVKKTVWVGNVPVYQVFRKGHKGRLPEISPLIRRRPVHI